MQAIDSNWFTPGLYIVDEASVSWDGTWIEQDDVTGVISEFASGGTSFTNACSGTATSVSRATMAKLQFRTSTIINNKRLQGGPYWGPLSGNAISSTGQIGQSATDDILALWAAVLTASTASLAVWHRPSDKGPGQAANVTSVAVKASPAVLRSRRD